MGKNTLRSFIKIIVIATFFLLAGYVLKEKDLNSYKQLRLEEILDIIKTDKDYNEAVGFIKGFNPEIVSYLKFGPAEYQKIKKEWQEKGLKKRIENFDKIGLTGSTYWVEIRDKNDSTKGLIAIIDVKEKKSLLLMLSLSIKANVNI